MRSGNKTTRTREQCRQKPNQARQLFRSRALNFRHLILSVVASIYSWCGYRQRQGLFRQRNREASTLQPVGITVLVGRSPQRSDFSLAIVGRLLDYVGWLPALLVHVGLDHLRRQPGSQPAMFSALEQSTNYNVWIAARCEAYEPAVLRQVLVVLVLGAGSQRYNLRRSSFSGDI